MSPYIKSHDRYSYGDLDQIFEETDVLVAPSIWYETFGYTVLEALSYGVPVVISGTVGAKDILDIGTGIVIEDITSDKLMSAFSSLNAEKLKEMNKAIIENQKITQMSEMSALIKEQCYGKTRG
jgi:glycosyltransferase involved in cell wall biosynthesis